MISMILQKGVVPMLELSRETAYKGVVYKVVQVLDNDLLLVVAKSDIEAEKYPLQTVIIPDDIK